jgi:hypothetical protein
VTGTRPQASSGAAISRSLASDWESLAKYQIFVAIPEWAFALNGLRNTSRDTTESIIRYSTCSECTLAYPVCSSTPADRP